jgi:hypothetical protein
MTCGFAARCAEKLRFSGSSILACGGYAAVADALRERQPRRSRKKYLQRLRKSGAFPHIDGQSPKKPQLNTQNNFSDREVDDEARRIDKGRNHGRRQDRRIDTNPFSGDRN